MSDNQNQQVAAAQRTAEIDKPIVSDPVGNLIVAAALGVPITVIGSAIVNAIQGGVVIPTLIAPSAVELFGHFTGEFVHSVLDGISDAHPDPDFDPSSGSSNTPADSDSLPDAGSPGDADSPVAGASVMDPGPDAGFDPSV
jgi:hypothetical protein